MICGCLPGGDLPHDLVGLPMPTMDRLPRNGRASGNARRTSAKRGSFMDSITFKCRACHTQYSVKQTLAGRTAECTKCGQRMQVPYRSPVVKLNDEMISAEEEAEQQRIA